MVRGCRQRTEERPVLEALLTATLASMINILQRSVCWVQQRCHGRLAKSSSQRGFEVFPGIHKESGRPRRRLQRAHSTRGPDSSFQSSVFAQLSLLDPLPSHAVYSAWKTSSRCVRLRRGTSFSKSCDAACQGVSDDGAVSCRVKQCFVFCFFLAS